MPHSHLLRPKYRPDIDGLRAVAILSVIAFHAFPNWVKGGFVGVDVFFVISGFLISSIIFGNLYKGTFSFKEFYSRRIKRIFPALILVMTICYLLGWFVLLADEYKLLGKNIIGGAGFVSNFVLWQESGYFDAAAKTKPLLHLWSLGIEEQFYIVWPLLIFLVWKRQLNILAVVLFVAFISFVFNVSKIHSDSVQAFYSPVSRFWELLMGSVLAYLSYHKPGYWNRKNYPIYAALEKIIYRTKSGDSGTSLQNNAKSVLGILFIGFAALVLNKQLAFPGWWALLPTIGSCLIISAGPHAWINRVVLSNRMMVWVGLISYPLYLWHWPMLAFARIMESGTPSREIILAIVALSFLLAWLTYWLLERQVRSHHHWSLPLFLVIALTFVSGLGYDIYSRNGMGPRQKELAHQSKELAQQLEEVSWDSYFRYLSEKFPACVPQNLRDKAYRYDDVIRCRQTAQNNPAHTIAIIGDSHAEQLFVGLANRISPKENLVYFTYGCLPFLGLTGGGCKDMHETLEHIIAEPSVHTIIMANYWAYNAYLPVSRLLSDPRNENIAEIFKQSMEATLKAFTSAGKKVIFAFDVPSLNFDPKKCITRPMRLTNTGGECVVSRSWLDAYHRVYREQAEEVLNKFPIVKRWDPIKLLCNDEFCQVLMDGHILYRNDNHITVFTSDLLGERLVEDFHL